MSFLIPISLKNFITNSYKFSCNSIQNNKTPRKTLLDNQEDCFCVNSKECKNNNITSPSRKFSKIKSNQIGASLVEYVLLVALIALVCVITIRIMGKSVSSSFSRVNSGFEP